VALFTTSETFLTFQKLKRQKNFRKIKIRKNISDVALFTTSETFLTFQKLKRQKNFRKIKIRKNISDVALFTTSETFLTFQVLKRQKILTFENFKRQNPNFSDRVFFKVLETSKRPRQELF
jgi:hypothetical protein